MSDRLDRARNWVRNTLGLDRVELEPASTDASFRRYFRLRAEGRSRILMDAPPDREDCRPYAAVTALIEGAGVHVPAIQACDLDAGFLLLEDLGSRCYLDELDATSADRLYGDALEALLRMQLRIPAASVPAYDTALVMQELSLFDQWFLRRHLGIDLDAPASDILSSSYALLTEHFVSQPRVFVHRDFHSRNLMLTGERNPGVLDFQDAVSGPAVYDVISLLRDVYVEWPEARVVGWMNDYQREALTRGVPVAGDTDAFARDADFVGAQRHLKIAGIFCRLYHRDEKPGYLRDIPLTLHYLHAECARQPELEPLAWLLTELDVDTRLAERNARALERDPEEHG